MRAAVRYGALGLLALAVVASIVSLLVAGTPGLWGALIGAAVGGGFILFTALGVLLTAKLPAMTAGAVLLGTWLLKLDPRHRGDGDRSSRWTSTTGTPSSLTIVLALVIVLGAETYGVLSQRALYVDPKPSADAAERRSASRYSVSITRG